MLQRLITICFYLLFFLTPLAFTSLNHELFEYNKMMLVYLLTVVISACWLIKMLRTKTVIFKWSPLLWPLLLFLGANIISTVNSIDPHTSIWGYYTRSNGGLLSTVSYIALFLALVANFEADQIPKFLKAILYGGLVVALYAIPEHFGVSPSCVILYHQFNASCWVQDVQARVFATLGQPNWLGAYLGMLIFLGFYMVLRTKEYSLKLLYSAVVVIYYMAFTFTYSRGATLGVLAGLASFGAGLGYLAWRNRRSEKANFGENFKFLATILVVFALINILYGSALTRFKLLAQSTNPVQQAAAAVGGVTQLESGGTESGQIRLIVWKGAIDIFKHYPFFGSGAETFAYSYYKYRPVEHNLVSEWDFLYNKAHNEYLNYLATTGMVGLASYLTVIVVFLVWSWRKLLKVTPENLESRLLILAVVASYVSYLVQNVFGFSVVVIALFFYLFPALALVEGGSVRKISLADIKMSAVNALVRAFDKRRRFGKTLNVVAMVFVILMAVYGVFSVVRLWVADTLYAKGSNYSDSGNVGLAYNSLGDAVVINPGEPLYRSELGFAAAAAALALSDQNATRSAELKDEAVELTQTVLAQSPNNSSFFRTAVRTYYELASLDPKYNHLTLETFDQAINLAPTDAKLYYNKALVLDQLQQTEAAIQTLQKAIQLKPNYREAHFTLGIIYSSHDQKDKAIAEMETVLKLVPNDPDALAKLKQLQEGK